MKDILDKLYRGTCKDFLNILDNDLDTDNKRIIMTVNPESIMMSKTDKDLDKMLRDNKVTKVPDGIAIVKACKKLDIDIKERITGIDISKYLLESINCSGKSLYLFGSKKEVIDLLHDKIIKEYPNINLVGYKDGYVKNKDNIMKEIIKLQPDVCLVALGIPLQEKLIYKYINQIKKGIYVGVGGSFDVLSGSKKRAPKIFIKLNLEWLYRIITEPKRLKRFWNSNIKFLFSVKKTGGK